MTSQPVDKSSWLTKRFPGFFIAAIVFLIATYVAVRPAGVAPAGSFTTDNLTVTTTSTLSSATASTLCALNASKQFISYAGSGCGAGSALSAISAAGGASCTAVGAGTVTSTGSAGWLSQFSSATSIQNWSGSGCGAGSAIRALDGSGNPTCVATGTAASPSVSIAAASQAISTVDMSALGTTDWVVCSTGTNASTVQHTQRWQNSCSKRSGNFLAMTLDTIKMVNYDTAVAQNATMNGPVADAWGAACSTLNVCESWTNNAAFSATTATGFGWSAPATTSQQVMRIYAGGNNDDITLTCKLTVSGTIATTTSTINSGATHAHFTYTVTFTGGAAGDWLSCQYLQSAIYGTANSVNLGGISLGPT